MSDAWPPERKAVSTIRGYLTGLVEEWKQSNDAKIHYIEMAPQNIEANGIGADWHPSVKTNRVMADSLVAAIKSDLGW